MLAKYLLRRVLATIPVVIGVTLITFLLMHVTAGNYIPGIDLNPALKPEDIEATIYSAMGINWTTVRYDDPFGRGFEYVPFSDQDLYGPINELWS